MRSLGEEDDGPSSQTVSLAALQFVLLVVVFWPTCRIIKLCT